MWHAHLRLMTGWTNPSVVLLKSGWPRFMARPADPLSTIVRRDHAIKQWINGHEARRVALDARRPGSTSNSLAYWLVRSEAKPVDLATRRHV